jgi:hypothetical protein
MGCFPNDNYLFAEEALLERLKELFPSGVHVDSLGDVRELVQGNALFPCACVGYLGDKPIARTADPAGTAISLGGGKASQVAQEWAVIVGAKDASTPRTSQKAREAAGKIYLKVLKGIQGHEAAKGRRFQRAPFAGASAAYFDGGHVFLTAQFNLVLDVVGD